ncbi:serine/threonine-protein kinase [Metabacillus malikii]|uniref:Serine/threonine-protein kinase n=1 Tax=Metabacillus malikii TaxID=1504265 RepID=A0ABT9ZGQ9_9BACI|nr:serine/threonine-protein kinase [Metabacillus malikii]MDQ0231475.1 serine/threonine-protein kinase [Metabacillus malikii]
MDLKIGQLFDEKYKILNVLGKGGMGKVYLAQNVKLGTLWAIKQVYKRPDSPVDFLAEPNIMKKLNHPSLPRIFDIIDDDNSIFIVLDYVEGVSLDKELRTVGHFSEQEVVEWAKQICDVYIYLHEHKPNPIIYRDMKPSNLMKAPDGTIKVIDFGIAREYKEESAGDTQILGTPGYAAPEQRQSQTSERSDIYSLGVTLYHLVTGLSPSSIYEFKPIRDLDATLSEGLEEILEKMLRNDPAERYQSARELLDDLQNIEKKSTIYKKARQKRRINLVSSLVSLCLFSYLTLTGFDEIKAERIADYEKLVEIGNSLTDNFEFEKADKEFAKAVEKLPEKLDAYIGSARNQYMKGNYPKTITMLQDVLDKVPGASSHADIAYLIGSAYFEQNDYKQAAAQLNKASSLNPNEETYLRDLAVVLAKDEQLAEAEKILQSITDKGIDEEGTWYVNGEILTAQGEFEAAVESFNNVLTNGKDPSLKAKTALTMAQLYKDNKGPLNDEAIDKRLNVLAIGLEQSVKTYELLLTEKQAEAYYEKAIYEGNDETYFVKAIDQFQSLIDRGYERSYLYKNIAIMYQVMDDYAKAEQTLEAMKEKYPTDYTVYYQLAMLYADMENEKPNNERNYEKTVENYELALRYSPEKAATPELQPLIKLIEELKENNFIE